MDVPKFEAIFKQIFINFYVIGLPINETGTFWQFYPCSLLLALVVVEESAFFFHETAAENFLTLTQLAPCVSMGLLSLLKMLWLYSKRQKVIELTSALEILYDKNLDEEEKCDKIREQTIPLVKLIKYYFVMNTILITLYNLSSLILMTYQYLKSGLFEKLLPFSVIVPISTDSWFNWFLVYLHLCVAGYICILYFTSADVLFLIMSSQVCFNFAILSTELECLSSESSSSSLVELVQRHQYLLKLSSDLEDLFSGPNFFNMIVGSTLICALGFNLMTGSLAQMPAFVLFLLSVLLQMLIMSVFGEKLIFESSNIGNALFKSKWYEMDTKTVKIIMIMRERALRPQRLTAFKFSTISIKSFTKIISTSWSYFTILRSMYKPDEHIK